MSQAAEIIYVAGPQSGQRVALLTNPVVAGRGSDCDIRLAEECISRKAFSLTLTREGWVFQNLTARKMEVSGGKYKAGMKVALDTGDLIYPGLETELLFVAAGADPEVALADYRKAHPEAPVSDVIEEARPKPPAAPPVPKAPPVALETSLGVGAEVAMKVDESALAAKASVADKTTKRRKYLVAFLIYIGVLGGAFATITVLKPARTTEPVSKSVPVLKESDVRAAVAKSYRDFLAERKMVAIQPDPAKSEDCLRRALGLWKNHGERIDYPYLAVKNFKLHLAYSGLIRPQKVEDENDFTAASDFLVKTYWHKYDDLVMYENASKWREAEAALIELKRMIPDVARDPDSRCTERDPEFVLVENTDKHLQWVRTALQKLQKKKY